MQEGNPVPVTFNDKFKGLVEISAIEMFTVGVNES